MTAAALTIIIGVTAAHIPWIVMWWRARLVTRRDRKACAGLQRLTWPEGEWRELLK